MPRCRHNPNLPHRSGFKPLMRRDLERRLARAEISAPETSWGDRKAADRRQSLRTRVALHQPIRERLRVIGVDPALAERLRPGDEAAAELAAIPDTPSWNALSKRSSAPTAATVTTVRTTSEKKLRGWQSYTAVVSTG
jgi:hypothetical protein